tara:strand:+ start:558 stop:746 length:189 start_codon:yes stop_codon:yes gene_type:complete
VKEFVIIVELNIRNKKTIIGVVELTNLNTVENYGGVVVSRTSMTRAASSKSTSAPKMTMMKI